MWSNSTTCYSQFYKPRKDKAGSDQLTGLNNRYNGLEFLNETLMKDPAACWIAIIDIDDFKAANDSYGHSYSDYVLRTIASIMKEKLSLGR